MAPKPPPQHSNTIKHSTEKTEKLWTIGSTKNRMAWTVSIVRNTHRPPTRSANHAHRSLPTPLAIEITPTNSAAAVAVTPVTSRAIGAACEIIEIPADVFRNNSIHKAYHCQVRIASRRV